MLPAGGYLIALTSLSCDSDCPDNYLASWQYFLPATFTDIGGSVNSIDINIDGGLGFEVTGDAVPEPGTVTLLASGFLGLITLTCRKRRFKRIPVKSVSLNNRSLSDRSGRCGAYRRMGS
jgi:hypothetical protein